MGNSYLLLEFVGLKDNAEGVHDVMMLRFLKIRVKIQFFEIITRKYLMCIHYVL